MKKIIFAVLLLFTLSGCCLKEAKYCGRVIEMYRTDAGYKSNPGAHVVFYCDSIKRNIDVKVTFNTYANTALNDEVCFYLRKQQLN